MRWIWVWLVIMYGCPISDIYETLNETLSKAGIEDTHIQDINYMIDKNPDTHWIAGWEGNIFFVVSEQVYWEAMK